MLPGGGVSGVPFPAPPPGDEFSVLRAPRVSGPCALLGLVAVVLGHIFAHKLTLVGVGLFRCFGLCRPGGVAAAVCHNFGRLVVPGWGGSFLVEAGGPYNSRASAILVFCWFLFFFWSFAASVSLCCSALVGSGGVPGRPGLVRVAGSDPHPCIFLGGARRAIWFLPS
ncbi:uncharacterized protein TM35_000041300 [Trypanosoma theileri]|uniref:Uncharacterized protein n=1 Tax=Trypanosoma theileri TaxID=67003 RepID=A0A1X0P4Q4_9TRYP|nr:uncharacterized protein TM35_000041300 [Trypanosoma theileri]ORC91916.1 hypothetical protein TM35_000041300 [Trypanosoma theileri]